MHVDEPKFPVEDYEATVTLYRQHGGRMRWDRCQQELLNQKVRQATHYAGERVRQDYERASPLATPTEAFNAAVQYQRQTGVSFAEAAAAVGHEFIDEPLRLNASGLPDTRQPFHYVRTRGGSELDASGLAMLMAQLDCSEQEAMDFWDVYTQLLRDGHPHDTAWAHAVGQVFMPAREHRTPGTTEMDSHPNAPVRQEVAGTEASQGGVGFLTPSASVSGRTVASRAPVRRGDTRAFKSDSRSDHRRTTAIPRPEAGALSPQGYGRSFIQHDD
jgi:hypothetical protein